MRLFSCPLNKIPESESQHAKTLRMKPANASSGLPPLRSMSVRFWVNQEFPKMYATSPHILIMHIITMIRHEGRAQWSAYAQISRPSRRLLYWSIACPSRTCLPSCRVLPRSPPPTMLVSTDRVLPFHLSLLTPFRCRNKERLIPTLRSVRSLNSGGPSPQMANVLWVTRWDMKEAGR